MKGVGVIPLNYVVAGSGLRLEPVFSVPAGDMFEAVQESLREIQAWMTWATPDYSEISAATWQLAVRRSWELGIEYQFAILDAANGVFLGGAGLNHFNTMYRMANLGYWVRTSATGQGVASRAARMVAQFGFTQVGLVRAEIVVAKENVASLRVAEKAGATREGLLRRRVWDGSGLGDAYMHSLIPEDFDLDPAQVETAWNRSFSG